MEKLNIAANRAIRKYPLRVQLMRVAWAVGRLVFRIIPRPLYWLRSGLLRCFGAKVGAHTQIANSAVIYFPWNLEIGEWSSIGEHAWIYNLGLISIGKKTTVSQRAHLCSGTHDYTHPALPLETRPIHIGDESWICSDAFVGPGISVGEGAVVGARSVVVRSVEPWKVVAGNPAREIKERRLKEIP